jgi:hypothetical protein
MEKVPLKDGRNRLLVSFYNGYELIEDLTIWPDKQGKFPKYKSKDDKQSFRIPPVRCTTCATHSPTTQPLA